MSNSVVKVTETPINESLILVVDEDGTVTPDKETVQTYLSSQLGTTELQILHINKSDGKNIDLTMDTLTYLANLNEDERSAEEMDEVASNLRNFRMDHDYTPLMSPSDASPTDDTLDELAQTLSILEGSNEPLLKPIKTVRQGIKSYSKKPTARSTFLNKSKIPEPVFKQPVKPVVKPNNKIKSLSDELEDDDDDEFELGSDESDENDSDFEVDVPKKPLRKSVRTQRKSISEIPDKKPQKKIVKINKSSPPPLIPKIEPPKVESPTETKSEVKSPEKKLPPKKDKKPPKFLDDFALFSTPDIIRRVGSGSNPVTPSTPGTPDSPKLSSPAKITQENRSKSASVDSKLKRISTDSKESESKVKDRRLSEEIKVKRPSVEEKRCLSTETKKPVERILTKTDEVQGNVDALNDSNDSQMGALPNPDEIHAIIQTENGSFITDSSLNSTDENMDQSQMSMESSALELDPALLDNINSDLIPEDFLYEVAQSLAGNPELQNAIDKSLVDGNLELDPTVQQAMAQDQAPRNYTNEASDQIIPEITPSSQTLTPVRGGTQIVRADGRVVLIPPIERPTTRSRVKKQENVSPKGENLQIPKSLQKSFEKSASEQDSSSEEEEDKSDDDPDKLWCICNQPHNNRFMICCDTCEEWYHGKCVNVTKNMGQLMEQEGREWICVYCKDSTLRRPVAAAKRIRKAQRDVEVKTKIVLRPTNVPTKVSSPACIVCKKSSRKNSIYCSNECILEHANSVDNKTIVFDRKSGTIIAGSSAPSAANLERWLKENPGYEVVKSTTKPTSPAAAKQLTQSRMKLIKNTTNDGVSLAVQQKGVTVGVLPHSAKGQYSITPTKILNKQAPQPVGFKIVSKQVPTTSQSKVKLIRPLSQKSPTVVTPPPIKPKTIQVQQKLILPPATKDSIKPMPQKTPKARQAEQGTSRQQENIRDNVRKTLLEQLTNRLKIVDDLKLTEEEVTKISTEIESQLYKCFGDTGQKYRNKYRSLIFNIKDVKNQTLWRRICEKSVNPYQLVRLSPDDLASQELALWRERENKHSLDIIKKSELEALNCNRQLVFKTHKGEQILEEDRQTTVVEEVLTGLSADSTSSETSESRKDSKERDKKGSKSRRDRDKQRGRDQDRKLNSDNSDSKERRKERASTSRERDRHKRSRSKDKGSSKSDRKRSRSRDRSKERHRKSHKNSRHKKDSQNAGDKLDKKSKEILEQLVDKQILPPVEDRLWKHVPQDDITPVTVESDSDHEPTSTVTIPTPPRNTDLEEQLQVTQTATSESSTSKDKTNYVKKIATPKDSEEGSQSPPPPQLLKDHVWKGTINMVDVAQISITAHEVSGDCSGLGVELPPSLDIVGRISPETVWDYIGKMRCSNSKVISLLRLNATNIEEKMPYIALYSYLSSRNRLGVVKSTNKAVKDFYILPLASQKPIPQALLPISGPGFEESRPPLLLGIIVRDKRKRPLLDSSSSVSSKRTKLETPISVNNATSRSYTPPPARDPRIKTQYLSVVSSVPLPIPVIETADDDEPYSPEDSDPEMGNSMSSSQLNAADISNILTGSVKSSSFLDSGITTQTFEPFSNKFDTIPGLDDVAPLPATSLELQRKMEELDQRIAMQKAEIDNMSQNIASNSTDIGSSALASIALPSNLRQILDSINAIGTGSATDTLPQAANEYISTPNSKASDLTIPLMLPKLSSRPLTGSAAKAEGSAPSPTIPLNLPKPKIKATGSPSRQADTEKSGSVLSSLSEEDLIRKAAEMLGETEDEKPNANPSATNSQLSSPPVYSAAGPSAVPPPPLITSLTVPAKRAKLNLNQPPVPGLEDEV